MGSTKQWRTMLFFGILLFVAAIIIGRLFYLQILNHKFYQSQALGQQSGFSEVKGSRGEVFFSTSKETRGQESSLQFKSLAINQDDWLVYAIPKKIEDREAFATTLATALKEKKETILAKLAESDSYVVIKKNLVSQDIDALKALKLIGLYFESTPGRYYPQEKLAAQVIGFVGGENKQGQYGIEGYYEDILKGQSGIKEDKRGFDLIDDKDQEVVALNGSDLYLTLDYNIQFQAESLLAQAKKDIDIDSGQIIVIKPDTGRILALANFPAFDPNNFGRETNLAIFQNSAVQKIFEPGSVFKPFTMAMALQEGRVTSESTFFDTGIVKIGPDEIYNFNHEKYGKRDMSGILEKSINTGAVYLEQQVSHKTFSEYLHKFGFDDKTNIDLQGEVYSRNSLLKSGSEFGFATASFGQGIEMTPIQLVRSFSLLANGGRIINPYIVEKIVSGDKVTSIKPVISEPVVSAKTTSEVTKMMINVVDRGFGDAAKVPGYYIAGKTGTAQVPFEGKKGYYPDKTIQSFIGFAPALNPEFLILVKMDNPKVSKSALSAAPIFKKLAQYIINYWQIPPDYIAK